MLGGVEQDWTGYAPLGGPPEDTRCSFCGVEFRSDPQPGWMIGSNAAICPRCIAIAARGLDRMGRGSPTQE
jgi:ClpX C4-type zinc finger